MEVLIARISIFFNLKIQLIKINYSLLHVLFARGSIELTVDEGIRHTGPIQNSCHVSGNAIIITCSSRISSKKWFSGIQYYSLDMFHGRAKDERLFSLPVHLPAQIQQHSQLLITSAQQEHHRQLVTDFLVYVQTDWKWMKIGKATSNET